MKNGLGWLLIGFVLLAGGGVVAVVDLVGAPGGLSAGDPEDPGSSPELPEDPGRAPAVPPAVETQPESEPAPDLTAAEQELVQLTRDVGERRPTPAALAESVPPVEMLDEPGWGVPPPSAALLETAGALIDGLRDPSTRREARAGLLALGADVVPVLMMWRDDSDSTVRWEMANIGGLLTDPRQLPAICEQAMADEDAQVRWRARWAVREFEDTSVAEETFVESLESGEEARRWNAAISLSMMRSGAGLDIIHQGLTGADTWRRWEAVNALGRVGTEASINEIRAALPGLDDRTRREAALTIGEIGGALAVPVLLELLRSEDSQVRWRACKSLTRVADPAACGELMRLKSVETDPLVISHLDAAIDACGC